jgi:Uma2 family endonuclease
MGTIANSQFRDAPRGNRVPPLQAGDRLTRPEFERRFDATPGLKKAELIEGTVYMPPPVSDDYHGRPHFSLIALFGYYVALTPGIAGGDNSSLRIDLDNVPQPDVYLRILESNGGQARLDEEGYIVGVPELVAEIAASSVSYDLHVKLNVYRRNGVKEYVVWRVHDRALDWFVLRGGQYEPLGLTGGAFRSEVFPGLWIDPAAPPSTRRSSPACKTRRRNEARDSFRFRPRWTTFTLPLHSLAC